MVSVPEADLRAVLAILRGGQWHAEANRLWAALDALGPEPCGHPSKWTDADADVDGYIYPPLFRCVAPKGHHAPSYNEFDQCCDRCNQDDDHPIHCGDVHVPPVDVWAES